MKLLAPDLLEVTRALSPAVSGGFLAVGLFLWLFGAASYRFWLALGVTLAAGLLGLHYGPDYEVQPLVAGLLLALAAGALALSLVRILLFLAGGLAAVALCQSVQTGWNDAVCFLCGGLTGIFFYRLWINALSSLAGALVMSYATLSLLDRLGKVDSMGWATRNGPLLNWALAALTLTGMLTQWLLERRRQARKKKAGKARTAEKVEPPPLPAAAPPAPPPPPPAPPPARRWWKVSVPWRTAA